MDPAEFLTRSVVFQNLSVTGIQALADICLLRKVKKKEHLFLEGDKGYALYILVSGNIQIYKTGPDGKETVIKIAGTGELFGEVILFESDRYPVSARALTDSQVFLLSRHQFLCLLNREDFRNDFIGALLGKMRYLTRQIQYLTDHDVDERLRLFLKNQFGEKNRIHTRLSRKDVASAVHTTPETLSRLLNTLQQEGRMHWTGNIIEVDSSYWGR